jgi:hypothetical protein
MEQNNFSYAKRKVIAIPVILFVIVSLISLISSLPAYQTFPYDTFPTGTINATLWTGSVTHPYCTRQQTANSYIEIYCETYTERLPASGTTTSVLLPSAIYIENISLKVYLYAVD